MTKVEADYISAIGKESATIFDPTLNQPVFLHTYVDKDGFVPKEELEKQVLTVPTDLPKLAMGMLTLPKRGNSSKTGTAATEQAHLYRDAPFRTMYIMASTGVDVEQFCRRDVKTPMHERILCVIKSYNSSNLLEMTPGFSDELGEHDREDIIRHRFVTDSGAVYEYTIQNPVTSPEDDDLLEAEREAERRAVEQAEGRIASALVGSPPAAYTLRMHTFLEIVAAAKFDAESLFVAYEVVLPRSGWTWPERAAGAGLDAAQNTIKAGTTQVVRPQDRVWTYGQRSTGRRLDAMGREPSRKVGEFAQSDTWSRRGLQSGGSTGTKPRSLATPMQRTQFADLMKSRESVAHFAFPIEFQLLSHVDDTTGALQSMLPRVYFTVLHRDSWGRETVQGYGSIPLAATAGCHTAVVKCWRPEGDESQKLREFFLGGSLHLRDVTLSATDPLHTTHELNKFGFRTVNSGEIAVRVNTVVQRRGRLGGVVNTGSRAAVLLRKMLGRSKRSKLSVNQLTDMAGLRSRAPLEASASAARGGRTPRRSPRAGGATPSASLLLRKSMRRLHGKKQQ